MKAKNFSLCIWTGIRKNFIMLAIVRSVSFETGCCIVKMDEN